MRSPRPTFHDFLFIGKIMKCEDHEFWGTHYMCSKTSKWFHSFSKDWDIDKMETYQDFLHQYSTNKGNKLIIIRKRKSIFFNFKIMNSQNQCFEIITKQSGSPIMKSCNLGIPLIMESQNSHFSTFNQKQQNSQVLFEPIPYFDLSQDYWQLLHFLIDCQAILLVYY